TVPPFSKTVRTSVVPAPADFVTTPWFVNNPTPFVLPNTASVWISTVPVGVFVKVPPASTVTFPLPVQTAAPEFTSDRANVFSSEPLMFNPLVANVVPVPDCALPVQVNSCSAVTSASPPRPVPPVASRMVVNVRGDPLRRPLSGGIFRGPGPKLVPKKIWLPSSCSTSAARLASKPVTVRVPPVSANGTKVGSMKILLVLAPPVTNTLTTSEPVFGSDTQVPALQS